MKLWGKELFKIFALVAMLSMVGALVAEPVDLSKVAVNVGNPTFGTLNNKNENIMFHDRTSLKPFVNSSLHSSDLGNKIIQC
ncbi:hypothetical protein [Methanotorris formicicus]|uniref:Uncharacterized protein n=1 Tax=Methanotorris formicicus Mc-S-70 TaxID=647171 RepID=H1L0P8_9EURY|nr:hypothetical protein [Methanotorris formicicus]EHP84592.1 hypothetical protein MetfoDRAFT_1622 [Methanotorris formicicus Mc-S-70]